MSHVFSTHPLHSILIVNWGVKTVPSRHKRIPPFRGENCNNADRLCLENSDLPMRSIFHCSFSLNHGRLNYFLWCSLHFRTQLLQTTSFPYKMGIQILLDRKLCLVAKSFSVTSPQTRFGIFAVNLYVAVFFQRIFPFSAQFYSRTKHFRRSANAIEANFVSGKFYTKVFLESSPNVRYSSFALLFYCVNVH